jgi:hypothetical protein
MAESAGAVRPNRVLVAIRSGVVVLPRDSRDQLIDQLRDLEGAEPIIAAFEVAGDSRPVELDRAGKEFLLEAIAFWMRNLAAVPEQLPTGIVELRKALRDELRNPG